MTAWEHCTKLTHNRHYYAIHIMNAVSLLSKLPPDENNVEEAKKHIDRALECLSKIKEEEGQITLS